MVFGMEAAIVISSVIGEFINKTFFEVLLRAQVASLEFQQSLLLQWEPWCIS